MGVRSLPKQEPRFALSRIRRALDAAGLTAQQASDVLERVQRLKSKPGRPPENDGQDLRIVLSVAGQDQEHMTFSAAARAVAADYPEHEREAVRKRLARKIKAFAKESRDERKKATAKELERLRQRVAELEGSGQQPKKRP